MAFSTRWRKASCVWEKEMALDMLARTAVLRLIWALIRMLWAKPAASSSGEVIFEPEESLANEADRLEVDSDRCLEAAEAAKFVLMTIYITAHIARGFYPDRAQYRRHSGKLERKVLGSRLFTTCE